MRALPRVRLQLLLAMTSTRPFVPAFVLCSTLAFSGCVVSFQDYPLATGGANASSGADTLGASGSGATAGTGATGGSGAIGGSDSGANGGSSSSSAGDSASGGNAGDSGGSSAGGTSDGGGSGASGGQGGSAGMPMLTDMIDDFEDGDAQILLNAGRSGAWFAANDGSYAGMQTPDIRGPINPSVLMPARMMSTRAMHVTGSGFRTWGAYVGASFIGGATPKPYDVSTYQGVQFYGKIGKAMASKTVRVAFRDYDTGFGCTSCGDNFGSDVTVGDAFELIQVPFADLKQQGWGMPQAAALDAKRVYAVLFSWPANVTFDLWIDDLSFY